MASKYSEQYKDRYVDDPYDNIRRVDNDVVKCMYAKYDLGTDAAVLGTGDTLFFGKLPAGARVIDAILKWDDLGSTGTIDVGWQSSTNGSVAADADGFFAAQSLTVAADANYASLQQADSAAIGKLFEASVNVVGTFVEATSAVDGDIELLIYYV